VATLAVAILKRQLQELPLHQKMLIERTLLNKRKSFVLFSSIVLKGTLLNQAEKCWFESYSSSY
jgi:hypothetical protein